MLHEYGHACVEDVTLFEEPSEFVRTDEFGRSIRMRILGYEGAALLVNDESRDESLQQTDIWRNFDENVAELLALEFDGYKPEPSYLRGANWLGSVIQGRMSVVELQNLVEKSDLDPVVRLAINKPEGVLTGADMKQFMEMVMSSE